jgi:hypothetical protein
MACKLYVGLPTLTEAEANQRLDGWIAREFPDLDKAIEDAWRWDQAVPPSNVPWVIVCNDGQHFERHEIRELYRGRLFQP